MRKGFTLLELIVVIVILGILATLGYTQYTKVVEKGRQGEVAINFGKIRTHAINYYMEKNTFVGITLADLGIGSDFPTSCTSSNYFQYGLSDGTATRVRFYAVRCKSGGKTPNWTGDSYDIEDWVYSNAPDEIKSYDYDTGNWCTGMCVPPF